MTASATRFVGAETFAALTGNARAHLTLGATRARSCTSGWRTRADVAVVAPATANVIAKLAHGLADDLLTATLLEFAGRWWSRRPCTPGCGAPGDPCATSRRSPRAACGSSARSSGALAHGDAGMGRLAEPEDIVAAVEASLRRPAGDGTWPGAGSW